jgi:hypothetical protein
MTKTTRKQKDWSKLKHALGAATRTPLHLEALRNTEKEKRDAARTELRRTLLRQLKFFTATAQALPHLLDLADDLEVSERHRILALVTDLLATGHHGPLTTGLHLGQEELRKRYARGTARSIYKAAVEGAPVGIRLLSDGVPAVRSAAAFYLAFLYDARQDSLGAIRAQMEVEDDPHALASAAIALGMLAGYDADESVDGVLADLVGSEHDLVRGSAAAARLYYRSELDDASLQALQALVLLGDVGAEHFPWAYGRVDRVVTRQLIDHVPDGRRVARGLVLEAIQRTDPKGPRVGEWVGGVLEWTFDSRRRWRSAVDLTDDQRKVVETLTQAPLNTVAFSAYGIPTLPGERRRWLGLEPPGPLDETIVVDLDGEERARPLAEVLNLLVQRGETPQDVHQRLSAVFDDMQILGIYGEWYAQVYGINTPSMPAFRESLFDAFEAAGPQAAEWAAEMAEYLLPRIPPDRLPGKGPPILGNLVLRGLYRDGSGPMDPRHEPLLAVGGRYDEDALALLPMERREPILVGVLLDPSKPPKTEHYRVLSGARLLPVCPTQAVASAVLQLMDAIRQRPYPLTQEKKALEVGNQALAEAARHTPEIASLLEG